MPTLFRALDVPRDQFATFLKNHFLIVQFEKLFDLVNTVYSDYLTKASHAALRQLIHLSDEGGPFEEFASGAYMETLPAGNIFPTSATWYTDATKTKKIVEELVTYNGNNLIDTDTWRVYDTDGVTVLATTVDTITYSGVVETSRTRTIT